MYVAILLVLICGKYYFFALNEDQQWCKFMTHVFTSSDGTETTTMRYTNPIDINNNYTDSVFNTSKVKISWKCLNTKLITKNLT